MSNAPELEIDIFADEYLRDPWAAYRTIRETAPVVHLSNEIYDVHALGRFDDVRSALRDWKRFTSARGTAFNEMGNQLTTDTAVGCDPPEHDQLRAVMHERLSVSEVRGLSGIVQKHADALVASLLERGTFDAVTDLAERLVSDVFGEMLGIPADLLGPFAHASRAGFNVLGVANDRMQASVAPVVELVEALVKLTKDDVARDSLCWHLFDAAERGDIPNAMTANLLLNYVGPGFDTTIGAIGSAIWLLCREPGQLQELKDDPTLIPSAVNEVVRLESPIQLWSRFCEEETAVDGVTVPAGSRVAILLGSANRDERHYPDPDRFDVRRNPADHVGFGHGIHLCIGAPLARAEVHAVLSALVAQVTTMDCGEPVRRLNNTTRGLELLPVSVS